MDAGNDVGEHSLDLAVKEQDSARSRMSVLREEMNRRKAVVMERIADLDKHTTE